MSSFNAAASAPADSGKLDLPTASNSAVAALASAIGSYDSTKLTAASDQAATEETQRLKSLLGGNHQGYLAAK